MRKRSAVAAAKGIDIPDHDDDENDKPHATPIGAKEDDEESPRSARDTKFADLAKVAKAFTQFRPASEVLTRVRAVPTIFPQFDHATRVGGLPIERFSLLHGPSGGGKALAIETPVLTPHGWKPIGEIVVGDDVIAADGKPTKVEGVYPQGDLPLYRVDLNDGSHVECCADHLWYTTTVRERVKGRYVRGKRPERVRIPTGVDGEGSVKSLVEIIDGFEPNDHAVPLAEPVEYEPLGHLPIDPYMLGLILGDGGITEGQVKFHKPEEDLQRAFIAMLPDGDEGVIFDEGAGVRVNGSAMKRLLMSLDLWGCRSWEKTIPDLYMRASKEDRLALLRGLFDTDGSVPKNRGAVEFTSTSFKLAEQVTELARSLGGFVAVADERRTRYPYAGEVRTGRPSFRLRVSMPKGVIPVSSKKHLTRWRADLVGERLRTIVGIVLVRIGPAVCIRVAHPRRLFVIKDFVVTHNTYWTIGMLLSFLMRDHFAILIDAERCYDPETEVLTRRGFVAWPQVREDDLIGCWDPEQQSLVYEKPYELTRQKYKGPMYRVDHGGVDLLVTPKHKMLVQTTTDRGRSQGAREIGWTDWKMVPADELGDRTSVRYRKHAARTLAEEVDLSIFPPHDDRRALLRMIGFFIGDGWVGEKRGRTNAISFRLAKPRKVAYLREVAAELGWPVDEMSNDVYVVRAEGVGRLFRSQFYDENKEKTIPEYLLDLNMDDAEALLDGLRASDGSLKRGAWEYFTTSDQVASAVQRLVIHAGGSAHIHSTEVMNRVMVLSRMLEPIINNPSGGNGGKGSNTSLVDYDGEIFCAHTRTGIMMVRRNGKPVLSGNTTPITWLEKAMGDYSRHPFFQALRPTTYEGVVGDVRYFLNTLAAERKRGNVPPDTSALIVVDSIRKLVPADQWDTMMREAKEAKDKGIALKDRSQQTKARMNATWLDEIVPQLEETQSAMLVIAREIDDPDAPPPRAFAGRPPPEKKKKTGGGEALFYDASMDMRSSLVKGYGKKVGSAGSEKFIRYGDVHRLEITKSKVSGKGEVYRASINFHISNGVWVPEGFDRARDVLDFARSFDIVEGTGWLKYGRNKWQGEDAAVKKLTASPELLAEIETACREESAKKMDKVRA